jgi:hypothetical protein
MKIRNALFLVLLFTCSLYAQNSSLFNLYKIPEISYQTLGFGGNNLLNLYNTNNSYNGSKNNSLTVNFGLVHNVLLQSPMCNNSILTQASFGYEKRTESYDLYQSQIREIIQGTISINAFNSWYIGNEKGVFAFFDPYVYIEDYRNTLSKLDSKQSLYSTDFGIGYGRIVNVRTVVQAYIIADELKCSLTDDKILQLADIIEKRESGAYYAKYKDDDEIYFYKDIAAITEKPGSTPKIMQILYSGIYQSTMRETGWQAKLGIRYAHDEYNYFNPAQIGYSTYNSIVKGTDLFTSIGYSLPIGFNKQFKANAGYSLNLNDELNRAPILSLSGSFSIDHSYLWSSQISAFYGVAFAKNHSDINNYSISLQSNYNILNKLTVNSRIEYSNNQFTNSAQSRYSPRSSARMDQDALSITIGLNYIIF